MALTVSRTQARKIASTRNLFSSRRNNHGTTRPKRRRGPSEGDNDNLVAKRVKLTPGIATLRAIPANDTVDTVDNNGASDISKANSAPAPPKPALARKAPASHRAPRREAKGPKPARATTKQQQRRRPTPTTNRSKAVKGLMHELVNLKPNEADTIVQGRKLRSQEVVRHKSELSSYFPEYDEIIGNDPKETHIVNLDTPIIIIPDTTSQPNTNTTSPHLPPHAQHQHDYPTRSYGDSLYTDLCDAHRVSFSYLNPTPTSDPLPDSLFAPAHKKAERSERSVRNTEIGRAQHERNQVARLLNGLRGHDWLRVLGVSGVTETKKRAFEPARDHFIRGCEGILDKFRRFTREEKRRRAEMLGRRQAFLSGGEESVGKESAETEESEEEKSVEVGRHEQQQQQQGAESGEQETEHADESDVDAYIAKQLREEALAAASKKRRAKAGGKAAAAKRASAERGKAAATKAAGGKVCPTKATATTALSSSSQPPADKDPRENVSLFRKRYQRDAALSTDRRKGRKVLAWGELLPEMETAEFQLPGEVRDDPDFRLPPRKRGRSSRVKG
ncbi:something about silencing, SAS, complex subunit 4-domain-containing protein [Chaetomium tenue]|uniref:Something about silencing, SAS, complex subunit 4-domain-containing protein n=1 Tax=Chaetomium tenue TaxID=1854479 RepID=A0ACB7PN58_9PEZI|nr:something about silencing, SAS, complex subunit 4-domain-containing protein [Chaetomium globosum]